MRQQNSHPVGTSFWLFCKSLLVLSCFRSQPAATDPGLRPGAPRPAAAEDPGALAGNGFNRGSDWLIISNSAPNSYYLEYP